MIILLPTQQRDTMRPWDGLTVLLANFPLFGSGFAKIVNYLFLRHSGLLEWPNNFWQKEILPEVVGQLHPPEIREMFSDYLQNPEKLRCIKKQMRNVCGKSGKAQKITNLVM